MNDLNAARAYMAYLQVRSPALAAAVKKELSAKYADGTFAGFRGMGDDSGADFSPTIANFTIPDMSVDALTLPPINLAPSNSGATDTGSLLGNIVNITGKLASTVVSNIQSLAEIKANAARALNGQAPIFRNADGSLSTVTPSAVGQGTVTFPSITPAQAAAAGINPTALSLQSLTGNSNNMLLLGGLVLVVVLMSGKR